MINLFHKYNTENQLFSKNTKVLLALSGGKDSMVLLDLFLKSNKKPVVAHCNFKLRGEEADLDEQFIKDFCIQNDLEYHTKSFETEKIAQYQKSSIQLVARNLRYEWFNELLKKLNLDVIATAHHKNDSAETVLYNLYRGTGIAGLHGILPKRNKIIRPLLFASSKDIEKYIIENKIVYREDSSNTSTKYQRNFIRHEVISQLEKNFPQLIENIESTSHKLYKFEKNFEKLLQITHDSKWITKGETATLLLDYLKVFEYPEDIVYQFLKNYEINETQCENIYYNEKQNGFIDTKNYKIIRQNNQIHILPIHYWNINYQEDILIDQTIENFTVDISICKTDKISLSNNIQTIDNSKVKNKLTLESWSSGDVMQPIGMKGQKKVVDILNDFKVSSEIKKLIPVVKDGNNIVAIVGFKVSDTYKIENDASPMLNIISSYKIVGI